jgi:hypothetical protein
MSFQIPFFIVLLAIFAVDGVCAEPVSKNENPAVNVQTAKNDDFSVALSLKKKSTATDASLIVTVTTLRNEPIFSICRAGIPDCSVVLRDENGVACPYTGWGSQIFEFGIGYSTYWVTIAGTQQFKIPLEKLFKIQPGAWTLDFDIKFGIGTRSKPAGRASKVQIKAFKVPIEAPAK